MRIDEAIAILKANPELADELLITKARNTLMLIHQYPDYIEAFDIEQKNPMLIAHMIEVAKKCRLRAFL